MRKNFDKVFILINILCIFLLSVNLSKADYDLSRMIDDDAIVKKVDCFFCPSHFDRYSDFIKHIYEKHNEKKDSVLIKCHLHCPHCSYNLHRKDKSSLDKLKEHMTTEHGRSRKRSLFKISAVKLSPSPDSKLLLPVEPAEPIKYEPVVTSPAGPAKPIKYEPVVTSPAGPAEHIKYEPVVTSPAGPASVSFLQLEQQEDAAPQVSQAPESPKVMVEIRDIIELPQTYSKEPLNLTPGELVTEARLKQAEEERKKVHKCEACDQEFSSERSFKIHLSSDHNSLINHDIEDTSLWWQFVQLSPYRTIPTQGYKLHVSAKPKSAIKIADIVVPILKAECVSFKMIPTVSKLINFRKHCDNHCPTQKGKFITIYPKDQVEAQRIAIKIDNALMEKKIPQEDFEPICGDARIGTSGGVFVRYGEMRSSDQHHAGIECPRGKLLDQYARQFSDDRTKPFPSFLREDVNPFPETPPRWSSPTGDELNWEAFRLKITKKDLDQLR